MQVPCDQARDRLPEVLDGTSETGILGHLEGCESCRQALQELRRLQATLGELGEALSRIPSIPLKRKTSHWHRFAWPVAAAALLMIAVSWQFPGRDPVQPPRATGSPAKQPTQDAWLMAGPSGLQVVWSQHGLIQLEPGTQARILPDLEGKLQPVHLASGRIWGRVRAVPSNGILETPFGRLVNETGLLEFSLVLEKGRSIPSLGWSLLKEAHAEDGQGEDRLLIREGKARWISTEGVITPLETGQAILLSDGTPERISESKEWDGPSGPLVKPLGREPLLMSRSEALPGGGWRMTPGDGTAELGIRLISSAEDFVFEAEILPSAKSTLGVTFPSGKGRKVWILDRSPGPGTSILRFCRTGGRLWAEMDGRQVWTCKDDSPRLEDFQPAPGQGELGLVSWGKPLGIRALRVGATGMPVVVVGDRAP